MLNIEEAIASYEKSAERYHKSFLHCKSHGGEFYQEEAEANKICYEHDRQLAAWLRELQERRKEPEIIYCKDCNWNDGTCYCNFHYRNAKPYSYCSWAERRTDG